MAPKGRRSAPPSAPRRLGSPGAAGRRSPRPAAEGEDVAAAAGAAVLEVVALEDAERQHWLQHIRAIRDLPLLQYGRAACDLLVQDMAKLDAGLWLGDAGNARDVARLSSSNVGAIVNLAGAEWTEMLTSGSHAKPSYPAKWQYLQIDDVLDTEGTYILRDHVQQIYGFISSCFKRKQGVFVHCMQGMNRSATACAAFLMCYNKWPLSKAIYHVVSRRPAALSNQTFQEELISLAKANGLLKRDPDVDSLLFEAEACPAYVWRIAVDSADVVSDTSRLVRALKSFGVASLDADALSEDLESYVDRHGQLSWHRFKMWFSTEAERTLVEAVLSQMRESGMPLWQTDEERQTTRERILAVFRKWDANKDGFIDADEMGSVLIRVGVPEADIPAMFSQADLDRDGQWDFDECLAWLLGFSSAAGNRALAYELRAKRPPVVINASRAKFKEQADAGKSKQYGAVGALDYELSAYILNKTTGEEQRERIFGLTELMSLLQETHSKDKFAALRFLDLGCGDGRSLWELHSKYGVPWSQLMGITAEDMRGVEVLIDEVPFDLRANAGSAADDSYVLWNIDDLDCCPALDGRTFDVVVSWITWCWLTDPVGDLEMVHDRFLAPGGILMLGSFNLMTDAPDPMEDGPLLHGLKDVLVAQDAQHILTVADAASGMYNWWIQHKSTTTEALGLGLGRYLTYHPTEPVHEGSLKATYKVTSEVLKSAAASYTPGALPSTRLWECPASPKDMESPDGYRPRSELDITATLRSWILTSTVGHSARSDG